MMRKLTSTGKLLFVPAAVLVFAAVAMPVRANLLSNGSFENAGPSGAATTYTGLFAGPSAADQWEVFNNTDGTTRTSLEPSTLPGGGGMMIHVLTTGTNNGLDQVFLPFNTGPNNAPFDVWLFVVSGQVGVGVGNGGNTGMSAFNTTFHQWEHITGAAANSPGNNMIIYSSGGGAEWYADVASVTPEPGTGVLLIGGILALTLRRTRRERGHVVRG